MILIGDSPETIRMRETIAQLRKSLATVINERNAAVAEHSAAQREHRDTVLVLAYMLRTFSQTGSIYIGRRQMAEMRGDVVVTETKAGMRLAYKGP